VKRYLTGGFRASYFVFFVSRYASRDTKLPSTSVGNPLQISSFMQNKPNLLDALMNVTSFYTVDYQNIANCKLGENKPNTNPIKPNFRNDKMNTTIFLTRDYENKPRLRTPGKQTQSNPISKQNSEFRLLSSAACPQLVETPVFCSLPANKCIFLKKIRFSSSRNEAVSVTFCKENSYNYFDKLAKLSHVKANYLF